MTSSLRTDMHICVFRASGYGMGDDGQAVSAVVVDPFPELVVLTRAVQRSPAQDHIADQLASLLRPEFNQLVIEAPVDHPVLGLPICGIEGCQRGSRSVREASACRRTMR